MSQKLIAIFILAGTALASGVYLASVHRTSPLSTDPETRAPLTGEAEISQSESLPLLALAAGPNSTRALATLLGKEIVDSNPSGPLTRDGIRGLGGPNPEKIVDELIASGLAKFNLASFKPVVAVGELETVPTATQATVGAYFTGLKNIFSKYEATLTVDVSRLSLDQYAALRGALDDMLPELYTLPVPAALASLHAEEISLIAAQRNIFAALAGADADPLKALAGFQFLAPIAEQFKNLEQQFTHAITDSGIPL